MCGFAGFVAASGSQLMEADGMRMANAMQHRGPDDAGVWTDSPVGVCLAHRRLSVIDLSPAGHQPMASGSGRYVIVFNGEIYNHQLLRKQLNGVAWRGHSDTETLLAGFDAWGIENTIKKSIGMFAFAVWDKAKRALTLGRDRLGEKPAYYGWQGTGSKRVFLFGSELAALKAHPAFAADIDRGALALLLRHSYVPAPFSIYRGIAKLTPGRLLTVSLARPAPDISTYWHVGDVARAGLLRPFEGSSHEAVDEVENLAKQAIAQQMVADVPLGAFLSGGVDSSAVVALMQTQSARPVKTFTIGFCEQDYNEAEYAKAVARHLGTDHTELYISPQQAIDIIPRLPALYSEPFADSSQIPTFLVSQLARQHVSVSLSGDGGDELFGGYNRYVLGQELWGKLQRLPLCVRLALSKGLTSLSPTAWNRLLGSMQDFLFPSLAQANIGDKVHKGAGVMAARSPVELHRFLASQWSDPASVVINGIEPLTVLSDPAQHPTTDHFVHQMMALDMLSYLPDDILCKVDRAAMGVSLETRVPLLDHRVVEFAWRLPLTYKLRDGVGKWPLREVLYRYVPKALIERPKMGFGIPLHIWLRGPLRDWAEDLLSEQRLTQEGYFHATQIREKWAEHISGRRNWAAHLWNVLMFQAWLR